MATILGGTSENGQHDNTFDAYLVAGFAYAIDGVPKVAFQNSALRNGQQELELHREGKN